MEDQQFGEWIRAAQYNPSRKVLIKVQGFEDQGGGREKRNTRSSRSLLAVVTKLASGPLVHLECSNLMEGISMAKEESGQVRECSPEQEEAVTIF